MRYIYVVGNVVNWKVYVGQAKNPFSRFRGHFHSAKANVRRRFYDAIRKYGKDAFQLYVLEECEDSDVNEREIFWISHFSSFDPKRGYNATTGGNQHFHHSEETRQKLSDANRGKILTLEHRQKLASANRGQVFTEERKRNIGDAKRGKPLFKNRRENNPNRGRKISESLKGRPLSMDHKRATSESLKRYMASRGEWHPSDTARQKMSEAQKAACAKRRVFVDPLHPDARGKPCVKCGVFFFPKKLTPSNIQRHKVKRFCTRDCVRRRQRNADAG